MPSDLELHSSVSGYGRAYQQGRGKQYNIDQAFFEDRDAQRPALNFGLASVNVVRESDPLELGVHRAAILNGNAVPEYVTRDIDEDLVSKVSYMVERGGLLVIVGDSTAGKTRAAYQALMQVIPDYKLINPYDRLELAQAFGAIAVSNRKTVLWLDDIERFIGDNGLTARVVSQLKNMGIVCVGTIRSEHYRRLTSLSPTKSDIDSRHHEELTRFDNVFNQAELVFMQRRWTPAETERATGISDLRVGEALKHQQDYGVAEYLAAGPRLYEEWILAAAVEANPRGSAIVSAAIDCQRAGIYGSVPLEVLLATHQHYLDLMGGELLRPESFELALDWAIRRRYGVTSLLLPGKEPNSYRAFDYLVDGVTASTDKGRPVPDIIWNTLQAHFVENKSQLNLIAIAAFVQKRSDVAMAIWTKLADEGSSQAAHNLGRFYEVEKKDESAELWFKKAIDLGNVSAAVSLGHLFDSSKRISEAEAWYELAAQKDDSHGMYHMGIICRNKGLDKEAEVWFRKAVERKDIEASNSLGELLVSSGRLVEAENLLRATAGKGQIPSMIYLGVIFANLNRNDEAEQIWLQAAGLGSRTAKFNLALLYMNLGRDSEAEQLFLEAISEGTQGAIGTLSTFLAARKAWNRAEVFGRQAFEEGDTQVAVRLGQIFYNANRYNESEKWYRMALDAGESGGISGMAWLLDRVGRNKEAAVYWQKLVDEGDSEASFALAKVRLAEGDVDEAIALFRKAAEEERDAVASCELGRILRATGKHDQAEKWLKASLANGHFHAACRLGSLYSDHDNHEEAEKYWIISYRQGHLHAAELLSSMLVRLGRGQDAATWLKRSRKLYDTRRATKRQNRRKKKR